MSELQRNILLQVAKIRSGTTVCAGQFARTCGTTLAQARGDLIELALQKKITLKQRNQSVPDVRKIKGPFRVAP